jgi:hypothetical protein
LKHFGVLGRIASPRSKFDLQKLVDVQSYGDLVKLILKKIEEKEKGNQVEIIFNNTYLLEEPSANSRIICEIKPGEFIKCLESYIITEEIGPRGGPSIYDKIQIIKTGMVGYTPRAGDELTPFI